MTLLDIIKSRYSCRGYLDTPVEQSKLDYILECVRLAPSAVNRQPWRFRIVVNAEEKALLQQCYNRDWFRTAPMYIVASIRHDEEWVRKDGKQHGNIDIAIAVEHLCLAATEQGLGSCWVCAFDAQKCHELLGYDPEEEPAVLIPIGYPAVDAPEKVRKNIDDIVK